jgi:serine/threonine protein kinase
MAEHMHYPIGERLPGTKYVVVQKLGQGGMGVVLEVVKEPKIRGVVKLIHPYLASRPEFRRRFFDEVRILAELDHPNIVRVTDYDELADGTPYFAMELLRGSTVAQVLRRTRTIQPVHLAQIMRGLLEGLAYVHTHSPPVVHRDVKSANVFIHVPAYGDPCIKLIDFGVAGGDSIVEKSGLFVGTLGYAAPEQLRGERVTPQADLYSAALILYEGLAGRGPFADVGLTGDGAERHKAQLHAHLNLPPPSIRTFVPWVPESIDKLLLSALSKDPRERPESAYAFATKLYVLQFLGDSSLSAAVATMPTLETVSESTARASGPPPDATIRDVDAGLAGDDTLAMASPGSLLALTGVMRDKDEISSAASSAPWAGPSQAPSRWDGGQQGQPHRPRSFAEAEVAAKRAAGEPPTLGLKDAYKPKSNPPPAESDLATSRPLPADLGPAGAPSPPPRRFFWAILVAIPLVALAGFAAFTLARGSIKLGPRAPAPSSSASSPVKPLPP